MSPEPFPGQPAFSPARGRLQWAWFAAWAVIGAGYAVSLVALLSIGLLVLPLPVLATILLSRRKNAGSGLPGLISGLGIPLLYVAWLNRYGPGTVCTAIPGGQSCTQEMSPWPWLAAGTVLFVLGVAVFTARRQGSPPA